MNKLIRNSQCPIFNQIIIIQYFDIYKNMKSNQAQQNRLPAKFLSPSAGKFQQFRIITTFLKDQLYAIDSHMKSLQSAHQQIGKQWVKVKECLSFQTIDDQIYQTYQQEVYSVLSHYNHTVRIPNNIENLCKLQQKQTNKLLPPPTPCEYVDTNLWCSEDQKQNSQNWIGHGYYWKTGNGITKDNYNGDYNTLQDGFCRIKSAKVLMADYDLLQTDFPQLKSKSKNQINQWLLDQTAYLSQGEIKRIKPNGDLFDQLQLKQNDIEDRIIDFSKRKSGLRYRGGGRAVNFIIDDKYKVEDGNFCCQQINVKGVGSQKIIQGFGPKQNGLLSLVDAIKEYSYQKLIQKLSQKQNQKWQTVKTYGFIDIGLKYKNQIESPATGYKGDRLGLTIRQASSRYQYSFDEVCYYSVIPEQVQKHQIIRDFRNTLIKWGLTSQQQPLAIFKSEENILDDLTGSWNIQADATMSRFLDFSQFYVLPSSKLPSYWKMSQKGLLQGIKIDKFAFKLLLNDPALYQKYLGVESIEQANLLYEKQLAELKNKYGESVGKMRKPKFSWSWFLETDDSEVQKFALVHGLNQEQIELTPQFFATHFNKWLDF